MINMKLYKDIVSNIVKDDICIVSKSQTYRSHKA